MSNAFRPAIVLVAVWCALAGAARSQSTPEPARAAFFAARIREFWKSHGLEGAPPEERTFDRVLDRGYVRFQLGLFDVRAPAALLAEKNRARDLQSIALALLEAQARWMEWVAQDPAVTREALADVAAVKAWIRAWKLPRLAAAGKAPERSLLVVLEATREQAAAHSRLAESMARGTALGLSRPSPPPCRLVLSPTRRHFVEFTGFLGTVQDFYKEVFWTDSVTRWTDLWLAEEGSTQVIALEYAAPAQKDDFTLGMDMNAREKTGLLEHVVQRAMFSLLWNYLGHGADPVLQSAVAQNMVIALYGENNARSGGSGLGSRSDGVEAFIPGAPGQGGALPSTNADNRWRLNRGADWFVRALRQAQKAGATAKEAAADKASRFVVLSEDERDKHLVAAPFLGGAARDKAAVPAACLGDYLEFYRAYKSAFLYWLQTHGAASPKASAQKLGELLRRLAAAAEGLGFESACREVYGMALGGAAGADTLEGRFLLWLAAQK